MTKNEYGTICLNLGFMSGMFFAASGDMPDEFTTASNVIRAICESQGETVDFNELLGIRRDKAAERGDTTPDEEEGGRGDPPPTTEPEQTIPEDTEKRAEAEFKRSVCERLDAFRRENGLGSFKELARLARNISADTITRIFNREPVNFIHYQHLNTALNKWEEQKMKGDSTACQSEN